MARPGNRTLSPCDTVTGVTSTDGHGPLRRQRCTTPDGLDIAVYDFGGRGAGSAAGPRHRLLRRAFRSPGPSASADRFRCWGLDLRGHGRSDRPSDGDFAWSGFATDVLTVVDHLGLVRPFGFGHSCGGAAVLLAEQARPGLFRSLYCFEPVVMPDVARALDRRDEPAGRGGPATA